MAEETFGIFKLFARRQCHVTSRGLSVWKATYRIKRLETTAHDFGGANEQMLCEWATPIPLVNILQPLRSTYEANRID